MERLRGPVEDCLIDDLVEWSMWHYATSEFLRCSLTLLLTSSFSQTVCVGVTYNCSVFTHICCYRSSQSLLDAICSVSKHFMCLLVDLHANSFWTGVVSATTVFGGGYYQSYIRLWKQGRRTTV